MIAFYVKRLEHLNKVLKSLQEKRAQLGPGGGVGTTKPPGGGTGPAAPGQAGKPAGGGTGQPPGVPMTPPPPAGGTTKPPPSNVGASDPQGSKKHKSLLNSWLNRREASARSLTSQSSPGTSLNTSLFASSDSPTSSLDEDSFSLDEDYSL